MAAAVDTPRERRRLALVVGLLAAAYLATRLALTWRFPLYVDETTFASFARDVHGSLGQFFAAEADKKGLLPSWLGAGLIGVGIDPVTSMRLLAAAGAALAAVCGGVIVRWLYGLREGLLTAALIALGPYFLVNASVGIYDAMVTGLVAAAVLVSIRLVQKPRIATALLLGIVIGAGGLTKPTASVAVVVLPFTLLLFDYVSPELRRRAADLGRSRSAGGRTRLRHHVDRPPHPALRPAHAAQGEPSLTRADLRRHRPQRPLQRARCSGTPCSATSRPRASRWQS